MKDSKGNKILIGDRVKVLWNFDNKIHNGEITNISNELVRIHILSRHISTKDHTKITKIPTKPKNNK
jgi:hypothetical protein